MLIRGSKDWGICIGKWQGVVKGVPGVPGVSGTKGTPGTSETPAIKGIPGIRGKPGTRGQPGSLSVKFFSLTEKQEWKPVEKCGNQISIYLLGKRKKINVDLKTGVISFPAEVKDVPEAIALGFSIAILHLLCQPYYSPLGNNGRYTAPSVSENLQTHKPRRIPNEDLLLVVAAGYHANYVPTNSYIKFTVGGGACGGCSGCGGCGGCSGCGGCGGCG